MAKLDLINLRKNAQTKQKSCATIEIIGAEDGLVAGEASHAVNLPELAVVTSVRAVCTATRDGGDLTVDYHVPGEASAAVSQTVTVTGPAVAGADGDVEDILTGDFYTGTGLEVSVTPAADMTKGRTYILIEYTEFTLSTGRLTATTDKMPVPPAPPVVF